MRVDKNHFPKICFSWREIFSLNSWIFNSDTCWFIDKSSEIWINNDLRSLCSWSKELNCSVTSSTLSRAATKLIIVKTLILYHLIYFKSYVKWPFNCPMRLKRSAESENPDSNPSCELNSCPSSKPNLNPSYFTFSI